MKNNLIGQKFGMLTVLEDSKKRASNGGIIWTCRCECGNITYVAGGNLIRENGTKSCGCKTNSINLVGQKFNKLTVIEKTNERKDGQVVWKCQCECGNIHFVKTGHLKSNQIKSCGNCPKVIVEKRHISTSDELIGKIFGCQKIIKDSNQKNKSYKLYVCECMRCKTSSLKTISQLRNLKGAYCKNCHSVDITNKTFGLLTAINEVYPANRQKGEISLWKCICQCGNEVIVKKSNLFSGNTSSCGCLKESKGELLIKQFLISHNIYFESQKSFNDCRFKETGQLARFDFYLPNYNLIIEYDGQQHYKEVEIFSDDLKTIQKRDNFKNQWCKEHNIKMLRIPYFEYNNIEKILLDKLS